MALNIIAIWFIYKRPKITCYGYRLMKQIHEAAIGFGRSLKNHIKLKPRGLCPLYDLLKSVKKPIKVAQETNGDHFWIEIDVEAPRFQFPQTYPIHRHLSNLANCKYWLAIYEAVTVSQSMSQHIAVRFNRFSCIIHTLAFNNTAPSYYPSKCRLFYLVGFFGVHSKSHSLKRALGAAR